MFIEMIYFIKYNILTINIVFNDRLSILLQYEYRYVYQQLEISSS